MQPVDRLAMPAAFPAQTTDRTSDRGTVCRRRSPCARRTNARDAKREPGREMRSPPRPGHAEALGRLRRRVSQLAGRHALRAFAENNRIDVRFEQQLRHSPMWAISVGTDEIQCNVIAQRGVGLPR